MPDWQLTGLKEYVKYVLISTEILAVIVYMTGMDYIGQALMRLKQYTATSMIDFADAISNFWFDIVGSKFVETFANLLKFIPSI